MLKLEHVTKYYDDFKAVDNLSFEVKEGEIFGLLGINGAGKTTTFRMIMGLLDKNEGSITLDDKEIDYSVTDDIGFLTEERSLLTKLTVKEQAIYFGALKGMSDESIIERLDYLLRKFGIGNGRLLIYWGLYHYTYFTALLSAVSMMYSHNSELLI